MATGSSQDCSRRTWISSQELHRLSLSGSHSPTSPDIAMSLAPGSPLTEDTNWFKKVPCCHLKSTEDGRKGQGLIVCLGIDSNQQQCLSNILGVSTYPALALLTNHHIITCKANAKKWKLSIHGMEAKKQLNVALDDKRIDICKSCCGRDGVLGHSEHPKAGCPFRADFTVLVLSKEFSSELLKNRELNFPVLAPLDVNSLKDALQSERFYIFKRDEDTSIIRDVELTLHKMQLPTSDDKQSLDGQITAYKQMCLLRYDINTGVSPGDSGAGIFYKRGSERLLLGLHKSTEEEDGYHSGIAIHAIFHAITGGEVCRLIPALSLLKDAKMFNHLQRAFYENVQVCFEVKEGASVQVSDDRRREITLEKVVQVLEYILKEELLVLQPGEELTRPSLDLLATIFDYCEGSIASALQYLNSVSLSVCQFDHGMIKDRIRAIYPDENIRRSFDESVCKAGERVCRLFDDSEKREIVESCFVCWQKLSYFPFCRAVFTESSKFAKIKRIRNSMQFQHNSVVQRAFGDICLAYQRHMRSELQIEKDQLHKEMQQQRENFEQEKEQYERRVKEALQERERREAELMAEVEEERKKKEEEIDALKENFDAEQEDLKEKLRNAEQLVVERNLACEQLKQEESGRVEKINELERKIEQVEQENSQLNAENENLAKKLQTPEKSSSPPARHYSEPLIQSRPSQYPTRSVMQGDDTFENFWKRDIADVLNKNVALRKKLAKCFEKITGSEGSRTWEHLIVYLNESKPNFHMNAEILETSPVPEILLNIILEWGKIGEKVTVREFCDVSKHLGIGRVESILCEAERTAYDTPGVGPTNSATLFSNQHDSDEAHV